MVYTGAAKQTAACLAATQKAMRDPPGMVRYTTNEAIRALGTLYCSAYLLSLVSLGLASWLVWDAWQASVLLTTMADISGASMGGALLITISWEVFKMVMARFYTDKKQREAREKLIRELQAKGVKIPKEFLEEIETTAQEPAAR